MASSASRRGFSANLAMLFKEHGGLLVRLQRARAAGFEAVEISTNELYDHAPGEVATALRDEGLRCVLLNMPAGDWAAGDRGLAALPGRRREFERSVATALDYARQLECPRVHCMAGIAPPDAESERCYRESLGVAMRTLCGAGVDVLIEPINQQSVPGYHLSSFPKAAETVAAVRQSVGEVQGGGSLKLLFDVFHCQILHGNISEHLRSYRDIIGHVQIAGVPGRGEPDGQQEINYPHVFRFLRGGEVGYRGHIGCEYMPRAGTEAGLHWLEGAGTTE